MSPGIGAARLEAVADGRKPGEGCGGALVLDLAVCLILAVTVVGLLLLAL